MDTNRQATTHYSAIPVKKWTKQDVADWARKVMEYSDLPEDERIALDDSLKIVIDQAINGTALLLLNDRADLKSSLSLLDGHALILWAEIQKLKKSLTKLVNEVTSAVQSLSVGDSTPVKNLVRSSVKKKKMQTILDLLEQSSDKSKALYLAEWFEEAVSKNEVAKQLMFDDAKKNELETDPKAEDFLDTIPLQDRDPAMHKLEMYCNFRFQKYGYKSKQDHAFLTIFGPSGAGKTRLCFEALKLIEKKAVAKQIPFCDLYLDFSSGARYNKDIDGKLNGSAFLAARVATELLTKLSYDKFIMAALTKYSIDTVADILNHLSLEVVIAAYCHKNQHGRKIAVALVLDEINELYSQELSDAKLNGITKQVAIEIGSFMRPSLIYKNDQKIFPSQPTVLLPVICGTSMDGIGDAIKISGFSCYSPEITLLHKSAITNCFSEYCKKNNQTDLQKKVTEKQLTQILQYFGVVPRGLEFIIERLQKHDAVGQFSTLVAEIQFQFDGWFQFSKYESSFNEPAQTKLFMQMCVIGLSCTSKFTPLAQKIIEQAKRAGLYYTLSDKLFFCPSILKILNKHFYLFTDNLLPLPSTPFYWQHFERLEVVKVNTWLAMGHKQIPITTLFSGATCGIGLKNTSILLSEMNYYEDSEQFPGKEKYTERMNQITNTDTIFDLVIRCQDDNPLLDIRSVYKTNHGKPVLIVKQLKHGKLLQKSMTETKESIDYKFISIWLEETKQKFAAHGYTAAFKIFYVWITNKEVLNAPKLLPPDLVLVDRSNVQEYFGPSISLLISNLAEIEVSKPKKNKML